MISQDRGWLPASLVNIHSGSVRYSLNIIQFKIADADADAYADDDEGEDEIIAVIMIWLHLFTRLEDQMINYTLLITNSKRPNKTLRRHPTIMGKNFNRDTPRSH